jgi:hypothetical protein
MSSFFANLFASQSAPAAPATPTAVPTTPVTATPAVTTAVDNATGTATNPQNPLDFLMAVSQNKPNDSVGQAPELSFPQETLAKVAQSMDYSQHIPQEALQALQGGDMSQLGVILNSALQAQYQTIMQHQAAITNKFVADRSQYDGQQQQQAMRSNIVDSSLQIQSLHPMAQEMFRSTAKKLASQYPDAPPKDIEAQTWAMMESLGNQFNRTAQQQQQAVKASEVDWDQFGGF